MKWVISVEDYNLAQELLHESNSRFSAMFITDLETGKQHNPYVHEVIDGVEKGDIVIADRGRKCCVCPTCATVHITKNKC